MNKGKRYREQALDQAFFREPLPWREDEALLLSLHTGEPEDEDGKLTREAKYLGYAPLILARNRAVWERAGNLVTNLGELRFATCDEAEQGTYRIKYWALRPQSGGAVLYRNAFDKPLDVKAMTRVVIEPRAVRILER